MPIAVISISIFLYLYTYVTHSELAALMLGGANPACLLGAGNGRRTASLVQLQSPCAVTLGDKTFILVSFPSLTRTNTTP